MIHGLGPGLGTKLGLGQHPGSGFSGPWPGFLSGSCSWSLKMTCFVVNFPPIPIMLNLRKNYFVNIKFILGRVLIEEGGSPTPFSFLFQKCFSWGQIR